MVSNLVLGVVVVACGVRFLRTRLGLIVEAAPSEIHQDLRRFLATTYVGMNALVVLMFVHSDHGLPAAVSWSLAVTIVIVMLAVIIPAGRCIDEHYASPRD